MCAKCLSRLLPTQQLLAWTKRILIEDFLIAYQDALTEIGFTSREIARMAASALVG